jgi:hypothetical protein
MKRIPAPKWKTILLAAGVVIAACGLGGCAGYYDEGVYSGGVYDYGWGGPYYYGGYGGYYGGYYPGYGGGYPDRPNRPDNAPPRVEHHGSWGPGNANVRPTTYSGGGFRGGGGGFRGGGGRR